MECMKCGRQIADQVSFCPYCGERVNAGEKAVGENPEGEKPVYLAEVKGLLKSGQLAVYRDRVEFITSSVQKTVFNYSALVSVKKGLDRISFITEDGRTESCMVNRKNIHEAFVYIENASRPYIEERKKRLRSEGILYSVVSSMGLTGGILNIMEDRAEFRARSGQCETVCFQDVKSVCISMGMLEFSLFDGRTRSFALEKELREEVLSFAEKAVAPYLEKRRKELLERGISYSFLSSYGSGSGMLDILKDRVEYKGKSGPVETVFFREVRTVGVFMGMLEFSLTDGTSKSFGIDRDIQEEALAFVENEVRPYIRERTLGFETEFGLDERIEINETRGVFHILRQGGNEISEEYPTEALVKCEHMECSGSGGVLGGVLSGGRAILGGAAKAAGAQGASKPEEPVSYMGVLLTIRTDQGEKRESVRFGDFSLGMSRSNRKYDRYAAEISKFMDYLGGSCPECELIMPALLEADGEGGMPETADGEERALLPAEEAGGDVEASVAAVSKEDQFGIIKYIEGVSGYIGECETPVTIAIQGGQGNGKNSILKMLSRRLEEDGMGSPIWFPVWSLFRSDPERQLSMLAGSRLVDLLGGGDGVAVKDRAIKVAKGLINITSGFISQGSSDGQNFMDALFRDNPADGHAKLVQSFAELVKKRAGEKGRVIIFIEDLDSLAPIGQVELLEAMRNFFACEGCVFVVNVDYAAVLRGAEEKYGWGPEEKKGKDFFDKIFHVSFRVPAWGYDISGYVKDRLAHMGIPAEDESESGYYVDLIRHSVGGEPGSMDRLFQSFQFLRRLDDRGIYESRSRRLMLFSLLCMQMEFPEIYDLLVRRKEQVTPGFLSGLCEDQSGIWEEPGPGENRKKEFREFAGIFCDIIDTDRKEDISGTECDTFAEVLDFSCITSR